MNATGPAMPVVEVSGWNAPTQTLPIVTDGH
jgi:hypothetical protein